jgi:hypothetical protein
MPLPHGKVKKNMRCFPDCIKNGHTEKSFCGSMVRVTAESQMLSPKEAKSLLVLGGIRCGLEKPNCFIGQTFDQFSLATFVESHEMIKGDPIPNSGTSSNMFELFPGIRRGMLTCFLACFLTCFLTCLLADFLARMELLMECQSHKREGLPLF